MSPPIKSNIWTYFILDKNDLEKSECKICNKSYSRKGRTTTSLKNHLKSMHPKEFRLFENADNESQLKKKKEDPGSMGEHEWTNSQVICLVNEYRMRPMLWDSTDGMYRVQTAKYEAWSDLADIFQCEIADLRKKLNSIFASHRREKSKVKSGGRSTWFLYPHMSFLPSHVENDKNSEEPSKHFNKKKHSETESHEEEPDEPYEEYLEEDGEEVLIKEEPSESRMPRESLKFLHRKPRLTRILKRKVIKDSNQKEKNRFIEAVKLIKRSDLCKKKDECDTFGEYIASSLRKHDERTRSMIKQAINNILFEQEMKKYTTGEYIVISNVEENPLIDGDNDLCDND